jgi:hypothetical protein
MFLTSNITTKWGSQRFALEGTISFVEEDSGPRAV